MADEPAATPEKPDRPGPDVLHDMRNLSEDTAHRLIEIFDASRPVRAIRGSHVATAIVGTIGFALFTAGIEIAVADIPVLDNGWGAMAAGLILLAAAGVLLRRFME
jgi:hypothetical protein